MTFKHVAKETGLALIAIEYAQVAAGHHAWKKWACRCTEVAGDHKSAL